MAEIKGISWGIVYVSKETSAALLVQGIDLQEDQKWVPKSVIHGRSEIKGSSKSGDGELIVLEWWDNRERGEKMRKVLMDKVLSKKEEI